MYGGETNRMGWGVASCGVNPSPIRIRVSTELPSPSASAFTRVFDALRGEGTRSIGAPAAAPVRGVYVNVKLKSPSFSIEVTTLSPGLSHTCLSLGWPAITPSGVPVKMRSPGFRVKYFEM